MKSIIIENTFTVVPEKNLINQTKLEPRIMKLLCLLIENRGMLVTRDTIVEKIWSGYPGGIDGLTQAISFLRKILNDSEKKIISTIPKSGYIFNGTTEIKDIGSDSIKPGSKFIKIAAPIFVIFAVALLTAFILIYMKVNKQHTPTPQPTEYNNSSAKDAPKAQ
jgi:DNA-binding winged helix-turn-helix (wHTH) protein